MQKVLALRGQTTAMANRWDVDRSHVWFVATSKLRETLCSPEFLGNIYVPSVTQYETRSVFLLEDWRSFFSIYFSETLYRLRVKFALRNACLRSSPRSKGNDND